ncbi:metal-sulfur cluster biosynthetic enzyme [Deinococcus sp. UYEF24]
MTSPEINAENTIDTSAGDGQYSGALTNPSTVPVAEGLPSQAQILEALKVVKDPEIPVNVVDLGLIYGVDITTAGNVEITMTLTSVGCPVQDLIRSDAEMAVMRLDGVNQVEVEFVWSPSWAPDKMSDDGKRQMRMFGFNV